MSDDTYVINVREVQWQDRSENYVYIGRPSKWGNPWTHRDGTRKGLAKYVVETREEAIAKYEEWVRSQPHLMSALHELKDKALGCWCAPLSCHGDVLVKLVREQCP